LPVGALATSKQFATLSEGTTQIINIAYSPNGRTLAAVNGASEVALWNTASRKQTATLSEGNSAVVAFSPNGRILAVGATDGNVSLWDVANRQRFATLSEGSPIDTVAFSPNGQTLAVGDNGDHVGLWDAASGKLIATLSEQSPIYGLAFSPNGRTLAVGAGYVKLYRQELWSWTITAFSHLICGEVEENMTKSEFATNVPDQPYQKTCPAYR
jgi:WD40 repeat protein